MLNVFGAFVLPAVPLLVLVALLLLGRFPGEEAIERLSRRIAARRQRPVRREPGGSPATRPAAWAPGGGLLIAFGLARRPPPALL
ncbi:MAG TPA: hypothetical protein VJL81_17835 [Solirubrobacterales bacterium]|nr:hypothetical protein [Solirubrobacterales bacterium]